MLVNRVGDIGLALGICCVFITFKTVDYLTVFSLTSLVVNEQFNFLCFELDKLTVISLLLF
jgi:NADH-ubiquinone oxidoreductase chain 5